MPSPSKRKGNDFERELVNRAWELGLSAERAYASNGRSLGEGEEVDCLIGSYRVQAKRRKQLPQYLQIPPGCEAVAFRQDRSETLVLIDLELFLSLIRQQRLDNAGRDEILDAGSL